MKRARGAHARQMMRAAATSLLLTMRLFSTPPAGRARPPYAIVREVATQHDDRFDPREVVAGRVVLTLPLAEAGGVPASARSAFSQN